jgi:shikimate dehydrogenase
MIRLGLVGSPIEHSLSPALHNSALQFCGLQGSYSLFPIKKDDMHGLNTLFDRIRTGELNGLNITIPHKQNAIKLVDELTPSARAVGAINTIYCKQGNLIGDNTDAPAFLEDLNKFLNKNLDSGWKKAEELDKSALILGAGGSARAVVYALVNAGWSITVTARRMEQAKELANSHLKVSQYDLHHIGELLPAIHLIINTTPAGMFPNTDVTPWMKGLAFPKNAALYDLIYNPLETLLVKQARAAGLKASSGIGMLVEQAALAFQLWTGLDIPRRVMFDAIDRSGL